MVTVNRLGKGFGRSLQSICPAESAEQIPSSRCCAVDSVQQVLFSGLRPADSAKQILLPTAEMVHKREQM